MTLFYIFIVLLENTNESFSVSISHHSITTLPLDKMQYIFKAFQKFFIVYEYES